MTDIILLVDDEKKAGNILKKTLESEGIDVTWAMDGNSAVEKMEKGKFDLIILELKLRGVSGDEILEKIRRIDPYVEVIVYTSYPTDSFKPAVIKKLFRLGVEDYINKDANADLWKIVDRIKARLDPFSEEIREKLMEAAPEGSFREFSPGEV